MIIEIIMILFLVGLVFVIVFPYKQMQDDKKQEAILKQRMEAIYPVLTRITEAALKAKAEDEFGDFPMDFDFLGLGKASDLETSDFTFGYNYDLDTSTPTAFALSKPEFGKENVKIIYNIKDKSYSLSDPKAEEKPRIKDEWLP